MPVRRRLLLSAQLPLVLAAAGEETAGRPEDGGYRTQDYRAPTPLTVPGGRMVTTIEPKAEWYPAEDYHQDYWAGEGQRNPYCLAIIPPKLKKLRKSFAHRVKSEAGPA